MTVLHARFSGEDNLPPQRYYYSGSSMSIGTVMDRLLHAMSVRGTSQSELARRIGVKQGTIQKWTQGSEPGAQLLSRVPGALNISGHWLLTGDGAMEAPGERQDLEAVREEGVAYAARAIEERILAAIKAATEELQGRAPRPTEVELAAAGESAEVASKPVARPARRGASA
jgi:transcriptional regulator with XRE-family HTH domain